MLESQLPFAHVGEASFIDQGVGNGPGVAGIVLLIAGADVGAKARDIRARSLEIVEGLKIRVVGEVVVEAEVLPGVDVMIEADGELVLGVSADRYGLINAVRADSRAGTKRSISTATGSMQARGNVRCRWEMRRRKRIPALSPPRAHPPALGLVIAVAQPGLPLRASCERTDR